MKKAQLGAQRLSAEAAEELFSRIYDFAKQRRRRHSISEAIVPEDVARSDRKDDWNGACFDGAVSRLLS